MLESQGGVGPEDARFLVDWSSSSFFLYEWREKEIEERSGRETERTRGRNRKAAAAAGGGAEKPKQKKPNARVTMSTLFG